jgi:hypothetical protein
MDSMTRNDWLIAAAMLAPYALLILLAALVTVLG